MKTIDRWQFLELILWVLFCCSIFLKFTVLRIPYLNQLFFVLGFSIWIIYFKRIFSSFKYWNKSKGLSIIISIFYIFASLIVSGLIYRMLYWYYSDFIVKSSFNVLIFGSLLTVIYYLFRGRKKKEIFFTLFGPVFIRSLFLLAVGIALSFRWPLIYY